MDEFSEDPVFMERAGKWHMVDHPPVGDARRKVRDLLQGLTEQNVSEDATYNCQLVTSELLSDAYIHGLLGVEIGDEQGIRLEFGVVRRGAEGSPLFLRIEVHDPRQVRLRWPSGGYPELLSSRGRGLHIVRHYASRCGDEFTDNGKVVWAEVNLGHAD